MTNTNTDKLRSAHQKARKAARRADNAALNRDKSFAALDDAIADYHANASNPHKKE